MRVYQNYYLKVSGEWRLLIIGINDNRATINEDITSIDDFLSNRWIGGNLIDITEVKIDEGDISRLRDISWTRNITGYIRGMGKGKDRKMVFLHRYIMKPPTGMVIDHINGDKLDNRRCNLRIATYAQNSHNKASINIRKIGNNYNVHFKVNGKQRSFGTFTTYEEAEKRRAEVKYQLAFGTLTAKPTIQSSTGERYVKQSGGRYSVVKPVNGVRKFLGYFNTLAEAIEARDNSDSEDNSDEQ